MRTKQPGLRPASRPVMVNSGYREENGELKAPKPDDHHHVAVLMERVGRANGLNAIEERMPALNKSPCKIGPMGLAYAARVGAPPKSNCPRVARNYGMTASTEEPVQRTAAGWRWLLYVALAIVGALLTFVGARAQQKATDDATFRKLIDSYCVAWSTGTAEAPAKFYAKEDGLVFYDVAPAGCSFTSIFPLRRPEARVLTKRAGRFAHGARNVQDIAVLLECSSGLSI